MSELFGIFLYFSFLSIYILFNRKKKLTQSDFVIGSRSMNRWSTALAAHASDMTNWLFMAYPGMIFLKGGQHFWAAIGLIIMMWFNWSAIAPKIRTLSEKQNSQTLCDFFEKQIGQNWPIGRLATTLILFFFYIVYVSGALVGMGVLLEMLFNLPFYVGVIVGVCLILPYILVGGYLTLAQIDLIQGLFLLGVLLFVPLFVLKGMGGWDALLSGMDKMGKSMALIQKGELKSIWRSLLLMFGWGLGYFGQPHIISKFMGIRDVSQVQSSKLIGMSWLVISLLGATLVGFVGIGVFTQGLTNHEEVFVQMVRAFFPPFISGIFLCAIIAAILNATSSMLLVLSTTFTEDVYKRFINREATEKKQLFISRFSSILAALFAATIALFHFATINQLVHFAWAGLGASLGPLLIMSLFSKKLSPMGALCGMIAGGAVITLCPLGGLDSSLGLTVAFPLGLSVIALFSRLEKKGLQKA